MCALNCNKVHAGRQNTLLEPCGKQRFENGVIQNKNEIYVGFYCEK